MTQSEPSQEPDEDTGGSDSRRRGLLVAIGVVAALVVAVGIAVATLGGDDDPQDTASAPTAAATDATPAPQATDATDGTGDGASGEGASGDVADGDAAGADASGDDAGSEGQDAARPGDGSPAAVAVCSLTSDELAALTQIAGGSNTVESLRDGITVLESRITALEVSAQQDQRLQELADTAREVRSAWRDAVAAEDAGDEQARDAALQRADRLVAQAGEAAAATDVADCG